MENALVNSFETPSLSSGGLGAQEWLHRFRPKPLTRAFFQQDTKALGFSLLGKLLYVQTNGSSALVRLVETESYFGKDPASHASKGITKRCAPMFEPGGIAYVYFIYGMYEMLNVVTEGQDAPGAVLIRGVTPVAGVEKIQRARKNIPRRDWLSGPGKLTKALSVQMKHNRASMLGTPFCFYDDGTQFAQVHCSPRVGIREEKKRFLRFFLKGHQDVSRVKENDSARRYRGESPSKGNVHATRE